VALLLTQSWAYSTAVADLVSAGELLVASAPTTTVETGGPLGDNYLQLWPTNGDDSIIQNWPAALTTFYWGNRIQLFQSNRPGGTPAELWIFTFCSPNGKLQFTLGFNGLTGVISAYRGDHPPYDIAFLGSSNINAFPLNSFFFLEVGATIDKTSGIIEVKIGAGPGIASVVVMALSAIDNQGDAPTLTPVYAGSDQASVLFWHCTGNGAMDISHEYLCDGGGGSPCNTFLGDVRVIALEPVSNDSVQFTNVGLGANWENAALVPPVPASDYNTTAITTYQDTYVVAALPTNLGTVYGVSTVAAMFKTDAGGRSMASVLKSGGSVQVNASIAMSTIPLVNRTVSSDDPATSSPWLAVNMGTGDLKAGVKVTY
jgi:hypothetical protein